MKKHALVITLLAALTACSPEGTDGEQPTSAPPAANEAATAASGTLELDISQTCAPGSDPQCIPLNDEHILVAPAAFERIGVDSASSAPSSGEFDMINVTLDNDGATVARKMTNEASQAGDQTRLVMKVGDEIVSAVRVQGELRGDQMMVAIPPGAATEEILNNLNGHGN